MGIRTTGYRSPVISELTSLLTISSGLSDIVVDIVCHSRKGHDVLAFSNPEPDYKDRYILQEVSARPSGLPSIAANNVSSAYHVSSFEGKNMQYSCLVVSI